MHTVLKDFVVSDRGYDVHMDWNTWEGHPCAYFVYAAACSEVEIDCLTGDHQVNC